MKKLSFIFLTMIICLSANSHAYELEELDLKQYQGKVVYLDFWASWCIPCRKSFPWLNDLGKKYSSDELVVIAVNLDKKKSLATEFLNKYPASFKIIYDPKGLLAKKYKIKGMPSSVLFGKDGKPKFAHKGFFPSKIESYEKEIDQLIVQSKKK
ncbi:MAG: thioredoxin [Gammaproteobacteria bacterium]|nr:MAG: thioredoxin [Gammaproteobacteria bacterium]